MTSLGHIVDGWLEYELRWEQDFCASWLKGQTWLMLLCDNLWFWVVFPWLAVGTYFCVKRLRRWRWFDRLYMGWYRD